MYAGYSVTKEEVSYADAGAIAIIHGSPQGSANMFLFYQICEASGKIVLGTIYGVNPSGHKQAVLADFRLTSKKSLLILINSYAKKDQPYEKEVHNLDWCGIGAYYFCNGNMQLYSRLRN